MKLLYFLLLAIFPSFIFAQSNYHSGYVLKNNGDTVRGYIDYGEWSRSPRSIELKVNKEDKTSLRFYPGTIKGFQITGFETYVSYIGMITMNKTGISDATAELDTSKNRDTVFLKQLVTGKYLTLYSQNDRTKTRYFVAETNALPVELKYYAYYNDNNQLVSKNLYMGQLMVYFNKYYSGNDKLSNDLSRTRYEESDLETFINEVDNNGIKVKKKLLTKFLAGLSINNTSTEVYNVIGTQSIEHSTTISPKISVGLEVFENPNVQQLAFRLELSAFYVTPRYKYPVGVFGQTSSEIYEFNQYTAAITPQVLFNVYNSEKFKIYIDAGIAFNFSAYSSNQFVVTTNSGTLLVKKPYDLQAFYFNFPLQAGVTLNKKTELFINYTGYTSYSKGESYYTSNRTISAGVKYIFGGGK